MKRKLHRTLAALLFSASILMASVMPVAPAGGGELLAASASCGNEDGKLCSSTRSCVYWLFGLICTTKYTYYPAKEQSGGDGADGGSTAPETDPAG